MSAAFAEELGQKVTSLGRFPRKDLPMLSRSFAPTSSMQHWRVCIAHPNRHSSIPDKCSELTDWHPCQFRAPSVGFLIPDG